MEMLNRSAITMKPLRPFLDWAKRDDPEGLDREILRTMCAEPTVYLLPEYDDELEGEELLAESWPVLFEVMLSAWSRDERTWPQTRTLAVFREWFEIQLSAVVEDLYVDEPLGYHEPIDDGFSDSPGF